MHTDNTADGTSAGIYSSFYSGIDDLQMDRDIAEFAKRAEEFNAVYKGKLADTLCRAITEYRNLRCLEER